ncbi:cytochrome b N-terminal domain-containing protein [Terriglobus saanensis]|uniref:Cytochrome b/b6 domain protein n=1 Tax=Terriglobus saanensis (strain ATCC BAA-1853 / DSM 23119 / SP1PR4) TaxID=401053 RepID=E8V456_TERSS|nr:cytochrome b N-terminal domain-containing protein [Terriglobus saanensis]ADV82547.1 Cytochrome b/b6 domain protein [Terriglobus saanensis SP1PR4]
MASLKQRGLTAAFKTYEWIEHRLGLIQPISKAAAHPTPANNASWWYVFGSAATVLLIMQVMTGILLALIYSPSANEAWGSLQFLNHNVALGWYVRALHGWGSDFMIAIVLIHMVQVFLFGAFKFPRELTWIVGIGLLLLTLGMAFTGQVMRFDQDAYWGLGIGASIVSRVPWIGAPLVHLMLGGPIVGAATLSRFFTLHVFVIPGLLLAGVGVHVWMVLRHGVSDWPMPGRIVRKSTYEREYHELAEKTGIPFVPDAAWKDAVFAAAIMFSVMACAFFFGPFGPGGPPDPTIIQTAPKPDFAFLWIYAVLAFLPPSIETPVILIVPVLGIAGLLLLPLFASEGERHWARRPVAVLTVSVLAVSLGIFTRLGTYTPWSPVMDAWTADPVPSKYLLHRTPIERQGALVLQNKQCRNCHALDGRGGQRGPALDEIAIRMTEDQIIRQVLQGGGNMPAYGNALNPSETKALVGFLMTLRGNNLEPAIDSSRELTHISELQLLQPPQPVRKVR